MSALPNCGSKEKLGARAELPNALQEKLRCRGGSSCRFDHKIGIFFSCGQCNTGGYTGYTINPLGTSDPRGGN